MLDRTRRRRNRSLRRGAPLLAVLALGLFASSAQAAPTLSWSVSATSDSGSTAVSCPSFGLCVAVDSSGGGAFSTNPSAGAGATWSAITPAIDAGHPLRALSCLPSAFCVAVGDAGVIATAASPGGPWSAFTAGSTGFTGVSCASSSLCVATDTAGDVAVSTNPAGGGSAWSFSTVSAHRLNSVSCAPSGFCAAVDSAGGIFVSSAAATVPFASAHAPATVSLVSVSCPSTSACVAVDVNGDTLASPDPTASQPTWISTLVDSGTPSGVSCTAGGLCVSVDGARNAFETDTATAAPPTWTGSATGAGALTGVSCALDGLCAAVDAGGHAVTAVLPAPAVSTGTASGVSQTAATLGGTTAPSDAPLTGCQFQYGTSSAYGSTISCAALPAATSGAQAVAATLTGLSAATTYHYRLVVSSASGTTTGGDASFQTPAPVKASPSIGGLAVVGRTLTCYPNVGVPAGATVSFQWLSDTTPIAQATAQTYVVAVADQTHHLSCQVTIAGDGGSASAQSGFQAVPAGTPGTITETAVTATRTSGTSLRATVACSPQSTAGCTITLRLTVTETIVAGRLTAVSATAKRRSSTASRQVTVTIGTVRAHIGQGASRTLTVHLNATGTRLLRSKRRLAATFTASGTVVGVIGAVLHRSVVTFTLRGSAAKHGRRLA